MSKESKTLIDEYGNIHYISSELARGGQGVVYRTLDDDLAIKQPFGGDGQPDLQTNDREIFKRVRTLSLPHGIQISLPLSLLRDEPGYVMKLLNGMKPFNIFFLDGERRIQMDQKDLPQWLSGIPDKKFAQDLAYYAETGSTRRRLYALYKSAAVLARLHNAGIVYGDVSLNNIFIGNTIPCDCWIIDADNLRFELFQGGRTVYTPSLGAPEIVQGKDAARPRTDCWAFAVMAFQMLALCHPFIGAKVLEQDENHGWDADTSQDETPMDLDGQAYAGYFPYIDDEEDDSNQFTGNQLPRALILSTKLRRLFQETLGVGRTKPHRRISMALWALALARAFDNSLVCPSCKMSYFFSPDFEKCPYCQAPRPAFAIARTNRGSFILESADRENLFHSPLPQRLFHPFSLADGDNVEYEAEINLSDKKAKAVRGTKPLPSDLIFDFIDAQEDSRKDAKDEI